MNNQPVNKLITRSSRRSAPSPPPPTQNPRHGNSDTFTPTQIISLIRSRQPCVRYRSASENERTRERMAMVIAARFKKSLLKILLFCRRDLGSGFTQGPSWLTNHVLGLLLLFLIILNVLFTIAMAIAAIFTIYTIMITNC